MYPRFEHGNGDSRAPRVGRLQAGATPQGRIPGWPAAALLALGLGLTCQVGAQGPALDDLGLSDAQMRALLGVLSAPSSSPGIVLGSPVAFGADWGEVSVGVAAQTLPKSSRQSVDGSMSIGIGLGDAREYVGLETTVSVISLKDSFGDVGAVGAKFHTTLPGRSAFAAGVENAVRWGSTKRSKARPFVAATKFWDLAPAGRGNPLPLSTNVGLIGSDSSHPQDRGALVYGGLAFLPIPQLSLIADWTGYSLNLGISLAPFRTLPVSLTAGAQNVTERDQGPQFGDQTEFGAGVGYTFRY